MMEIIIASTNKHKTDEIRRIFNYSGIGFRSLHDFPGIRLAEENGHTFLENAEIKAKHYFTYLKQPVMADDSGLVVPALNHEPGVHSARYAGENASYQENNMLLLKKMANLTGESRMAYFICAVVFFDGTQVISSEGRVEGVIIEKEKGSSGFGYDPLFLYPPAEKTFAELTGVEKNKVSHRSRALAGLRDKLEKILDIYS